MQILENRREPKVLWPTKDKQNGQDDHRKKFLVHVWRVATFPSTEESFSGLSLRISNTERISRQDATEFTKVKI